ncbi:MULTISPECIES: glycosyltransferase family 9 protein [Chitinophaga]|uniref:glycosyltransferase family 9 protein n=1 Tax=Chitinophaga TaxID=79328 RepID=UPI00145D1479|nr:MULTISPECIES: glycosyltransferase family 9 protein [Chitinophaga]
MQPTLFCNKNVKEIIADLYNVTLTDKKVQIYLSDEEDRNAQKRIAAYKNPIVMHITSRTTSNQEWQIHNWNELVASMPEYTFLQVGLEDEKPVKNAVDLRGKTSIRETFGLIKYARSFAGVNSIYSHATNAFDTPGVVVWGPAQPTIWGHENNINIYKAVRCSPCLDLILGHPCPYDKRCMSNISVDEVRTALLRQLTCPSTSNR